MRGTRHLPSGGPLPGVTTGHNVPRQRRDAVRAGWNDAAWGQSRRPVEPDLAPWYEQGYEGGLVFRRKQQAPASQDLLAPPPRILPAA
jgi:hypothetical protein